MSKTSLGKINCFYCWYENSYRSSITESSNQSLYLYQPWDLIILSFLLFLSGKRFFLSLTSQHWIWRVPELCLMIVLSDLQLSASVLPVLVLTVQSWQPEMSAGYISRSESTQCSDIWTRMTENRLLSIGMALVCLHYPYFLAWIILVWRTNKKPNMRDIFSIKQTGFTS